MKSLILILISLFGLNVFAVSTVYCDGLNSDATLTLMVGAKNEVSSARPQINNSFSQSFLARFIRLWDFVSIGVFLE